MKLFEWKPSSMACKVCFVLFKSTVCTRLGSHLRQKKQIIHRELPKIELLGYTRIHMNIYICHWLPLYEPFWTNWLHTPMMINWSCEATSRINKRLNWSKHSIDVVTTTAVQRYSRTRCLINFLRRVFCIINTESSQLIYRNNLKLKCKYKS